MSEFFEIVDLKWGPVQYELGIRHDANFLNWHIRMKGHETPKSVYLKEFEFLRNIIVEKQLKNGYECGTAFGVSSVAIGLGFKETGGQLVTLDAYVEEAVEDCSVYKEMPEQVYYDKDGFKSTNYLIEYFRLKDVVKPEVGWSPKDVGPAILKHTKEKIDFAFIDAGHFPQQLIFDLLAIRPFLADEYVIVLHDCFHYMITPEVENFIQEFFGKPLEIVVTGYDGYNMAVIDNKKI